jgi:hypothetical protein
MTQDRRPAPERRATPRAADSRRSPARPTRTATLSQTGTDHTRPPAGAAPAEQIRRDAEHARDARRVTGRRADTGTRVAQPPGERRRRPASAEDGPTGGPPRVRGEARASGRPAPTRDAGRADGRTGTARVSRGIGDIISASLRRARAALRGLVAGPVRRAVRRMVRRLSSRVTGALRDFAGPRGGLLRAAVAAVQAVLAGRNPVVAALKAWFVALSTPMKILVVVGLVLLALLAPLLLLLLLLAVAVAVVVIVVRSPATA